MILDMSCSRSESFFWFRGYTMAKNDSLRRDLYSDDQNDVILVVTTRCEVESWFSHQSATFYIIEALFSSYK